MSFIKNNLRVFVAVTIALVLIVISMILIATNGKPEDNHASLEHEGKEELIIETTGMSGKDAITIIKDNYYSNNYDFFVEVTDDSLYKVVAVNKTDDSEIVYFVDPVNEKTYVNIDAN